MDKLKAFWEITTKYPILIIGVVLLLIGAIGLVPLGEHRYPISEPWRWILLFVGLVLITIDVVRYLRHTPEESLAKVRGGINRPANNDAVLSAIGTEGWVKDVEKDQHLWLVIEVDNRKWPKAGEIQADKSGAWQGRVFEDGTGDRFSLSLFVANENGHKKIEEWIDIGSLIGYHPFELDIPGTRRLARIDNLHKQPRG
jgi:hypothetical protein